MKNIIKNTNKKGFTIVELAIVIAVIAILAAVLIPTFSGVIEKAHQSAALQEAQAVYKDVYAVDLSDGMLDGKFNGETDLQKALAAAGIKNPSNVTTYNPKATETKFEYNTGTYKVTLTVNNTVETWKATKTGSTGA